MSKVQVFTDFHIWPDLERLNPERWLSNFKKDERPYALNILNVFLHYNERLIDAMFHAAIHSLSAEFEDQSDWNAFLSEVTVTFVQGESPNPTESGYHFARKIRQVIGIDQSRIVHPGVALGRLLRNPRSPILFVDDFVGSGNQMAAEWHRMHNSDELGDATSFDAACKSDSTIYYVPIVAASLGMTRIESECVGLKTRPCHVLDSGYSLTSPDSFLWPDGLKSAAGDVLLTASRRAGIVEHCPDGWQGYHDLALAISFGHSVPDATLPLIYWDRGDWRPLIRRT